jgi:hypothetical protein
VWLIELWYWLLQLFGWPKPVKEFSMQKAILTWKDPSGPMTGVEISMRVSGAPNFTALSTVAKGVQKLEVPDLVDGTYEFRAVVVNGSKRSKGVTISGKVESVPGDVSDFAVAFE